MAGDLRVLIIADDPLVRAGLAGLVAGEQGCLVVGRVESADDLTSEVETYRPDVLLWDLGVGIRGRSRKRWEVWPR